MRAVYSTVSRRGLAVRRLAVALLVAVLAMLLLPGLALADEPLAVFVDVPAEGMIGEPLAVVIAFDNASPDTVGYGPFLDVVIPTNGIDGATSAPKDGLSVVSSTYLGMPLTPIALPFPNDGGGVGCIDHPLAVDAAGLPLEVCGPAGDTLYVYQLPFGSFTPGQPMAPVTIDLNMSNLADLGTPLDIRARAGFMYGADPLANPSTDPSIVFDDSTDSTDWASQGVTPTLIKLKKVYVGPEDETATGPNFPRRYVIEIDIADGQTITNLEVTDILSPYIAYLSLVSVTPGSYEALQTPTLLVADVAPNNDLVVRLASVLGTTSEVDARVEFEFFVPQYAAPAMPIEYILPQASGDDRFSENNAWAIGDWTPIDTRDRIGSLIDNAVADPVGIEHELEEQSNAIQKGGGL